MCLCVIACVYMTYGFKPLSIFIILSPLLSLCVCVFLSVKMHVFARKIERKEEIMYMIQCIRNESHRSKCLLPTASNNSISDSHLRRHCLLDPSPSTQISVKNNSVGLTLCIWLPPLNEKAKMKIESKSESRNMRRVTIESDESYGEEVGPVTVSKLHRNSIWWSF